MALAWRRTMVMHGMRLAMAIADWRIRMPRNCIDHMRRRTYAGGKDYEGSFHQKAKAISASFQRNEEHAAGVKRENESLFPFEQPVVGIILRSSPAHLKVTQANI